MLNTSNAPGLAAPALAAAIGLGGAALGLRLSELQCRTRIVVPFSASVPMGVALFGLLPELGAEIGWPTATLLFLSGYCLLLLINRYIYPVCPTCSHDHDHDRCATELQGFAVPLVAVAAVHSFLDGWSIATAQIAVPLGIRVAVPLAIALHKVPEGIALGGVLRASMHSRAAVLGWCALAQGSTLLGGGLGLLMAPHLGSQWITYPLGVAGGWLAYLGYHAVHREWRRKSSGPAFASILARLVGTHRPAARRGSLCPIVSVDGYPSVGRGRRGTSGGVHQGEDRGIGGPMRSARVQETYAP